jgi:EH domain-containing protein 1
LLRVHGSLLWSLGKILTTPEVPRVYVGSYWSSKNPHCDNLDLIEHEEHDLLLELSHLPANNIIRKINLITRRCRQVRVHALIISYLKEHSSSFWFRAETQKHELMTHLELVFREISRLHSDIITSADFPDIAIFQKQLETVDWSSFHQLKYHEDLVLLEHVNELLSVDLSLLLHEIVESKSHEMNAGGHGGGGDVVDGKNLENSPLIQSPGEIVDTSKASHDEEQKRYTATATAATATTRRRGKYHGEEFYSLPLLI